MEQSLQNTLNELELMKASLETGNTSLDSIEEVVLKLNAIVDDSEKSLNNLIIQINNDEETVHNTEG
jgi:tetrahydromethanopterin S-methyltransferase subunit B